jgi:asparagine synthase (glutamine-hydrolysing)
MCGITGALDLRGQREFPTKQLLSMMDAIAHRGPDDEQCHIEPGIALGVRRLSIMDVANGAQPFKNETKEIITTVNAELFDYPDLRRDLLARGHQLQTHCDSEVWAHLYEDHHEGLFEYTQGQFAVAIWDRKHRTLLLGRDRVGICPLYYAEKDGWLLWGSEIKALLASGLVPAEPDLKGIDYMFNFYGPGTHRSFFKGVKLLPPGHFLKVKDGRIEMHKYWDFDFPDQGRERKEADPTVLVDELEALLTKAIERRLRSDVPVASYLSGGLDSSVVLTMSSRIHGKPLPSFTIGMHKKTGPDEQADARQVADYNGSRLTTLPMDAGKIAQSFPEFIIASEGPVLDTSCAALMQLANEIRNHGFKVALTGEGADEALAGYIWFKSQKILNWTGTSFPTFLRKLVRNSVTRNPRGMPIIEEGVKGVRPAQQDMYEAISLSRDIFYSNAMWENIGDYNPYADLVLPNDNIKRWDPLNQSIYVNYKVMLAGLLLISKGDRIAMHSSVETRFPFLDHDLINFCSSISPQYKLNGLTDKWLLRQVAKRILPADVARRPKSMFRSKLSPIFFSADSPAWVEQLLSSESLIKAGYFDPIAVAQERKRLASLPRIMPRQFVAESMLTCVITTQLWHHLFFGGGLCELPVWKPVERKVEVVSV